MNRCHCYLIQGLVAAYSVVACNAQEVTKTDLRGVYSVNGQLHINTFGKPEGKPITSGHSDMKPSWSKTGGKVVFFRVTKFAPHVANWRTAICVVKTDGTGFRQITDGLKTDYNPTWTRDGKNNIVFSRYDAGQKKCVVHMSTADSTPGDEVVVSDPRYSEYVLSSLKDGRLFISSSRNPSLSHYFLLTPNSAGKPVHEPVSFTFPVEGPLDRLSVAPSETKMTYEYRKGWAAFQYTGKTLYVADFDVKTRTASRPIPISDQHPRPETLTLYPRWTKDESAVVYHCNKSGRNQLYLYRLRDGSTTKVSTNENADYTFPCGEETPK